MTGNPTLSGDDLAATLEDVRAVLRGEADELEAREDTDAHMRDVIEQLRHNADQIDERLSEYYSEGPVFCPHCEGRVDGDHRHSPDCPRRELPIERMRGNNNA